LLTQLEKHDFDLIESKYYFSPEQKEQYQMLKKIVLEEVSNSNGPNQQAEQPVQPPKKHTGLNGEDINIPGASLEEREQNAKIISNKLNLAIRSYKGCKDVISVIEAHKQGTQGIENLMKS
jgi:hypothetical protein